MAIVRPFRHGDVDRFGDQLAELFREVGLGIQPGSCLERMILSTWDIIERTKNSGARHAVDIRPLFGDMCALAELATQILAVRHHPSFESLLPHLALLNHAEGAQNREAPVTDREANKVFELLVACYAMQISRSVKLDDPKHSKGDNPDVLMTLPGGPFGIACKVLHSKSPKTFVDRLAEGVDQIERSVAHNGIVFLSLKNILSYDRYWPQMYETSTGDRRYEAFTDFDEPLSMLKVDVNAIRDSLVSLVDGDDNILRAIFLGKKALPVALLYAHVMSAVVVDGVPVPATLKFPAAITMGSVEPPFGSFLEALSRIIQAPPQSY